MFSYYKLLLLLNSPTEAVKNKMVWELYLTYPFPRLLALPIVQINQQPTPIITISLSFIIIIKQIYVKWCGAIDVIFVLLQIFARNLEKEDNFNNTFLYKKSFQLALQVELSQMQRLIFRKQYFCLILIKQGLTIYQYFINDSHFIEFVIKKQEICLDC